jgi:S-layer homology domain.
MAGRLSVAAKKIIPCIMTGFFILAGLWFGADHAHAEGSRELVQTSAGEPDAYRPYLGWRPWSTNFGIQDRTTFNVYVIAGETIYLGSSVSDSYLDTDDGETAGQQWDIVVTSPSGAVHRLDVVNGGQGHIDTLAKEQGPAPLYAGGYDPLEIVSDETGWWSVEFHGEKNNLSPGTLDPTARKADELWSTQNANIAAWDVTVADSDGNEKKGRMYSNLLSLSMGSGTAALYSEIYVLTKDGYLYRMDLNGIQPFGFMLFANNRGFVDRTTGETLNRSVKFEYLNGSTQINPIYNLAFQDPLKPDDLDVTHRIFLNPPSADLPDDWLEPIPVPEPDEVAFAGRTDNKAVIGEGGTFRFAIDETLDASQRFAFQLIIDADKDGVYEAAGNDDIVIYSVAKPGLNEVEWNGKHRNGADLPLGDYKAKVMMKGGEYHFTMYDVEHASNGIIIEALNAPGAYPVGKNEFTIYYNDTNYVTGSGETMNLDGVGAPSPRDASDGVDSSAGAHRFTNNYGDNKGIDTWTYYPGPEAEISFSVMNGPTAHDPGAVEVDEDDAVEIELSGTDTETAPEDLTFDIAADPDHGTVSLIGNKAIYKPDADYNGTDSFQFVAIDEDGVESRPVTVSITVKPVNDKPAADPQDVDTDEDEPVIITLSGSDKETDTDDLVYQVVDQPGNGAVSISGRTVTYTPDDDFFGTDQFTFTVTDKGDGTDGPRTSDPATVTITVRGINDPPAAKSKHAATAEDTPVSIQLEGEDAEDGADDLIYTVVSGPTNGSGVLNGRTYTYTPAPYYNGSDSFSFTVTDSEGAVSAPAVVTIQVVAVDSKPIALDDAADTDEDTPVGIQLTGWDAETSADDLVYAVVSGPSRGSLSGTGRNLTYMPDPDYNGTDSFAFTVTDSVYTSDPGTITITIRAVNDRPQAEDLSLTTPYNRAVTVTLDGSDAETPAGQLVFDIVQGPAHGTLSGTGRELVYTPNPGFHGTDQFTYTVTDLGDGADGPKTSLPAAVTITVSAPPPPADPKPSDPKPSNPPADPDPDEDEIIIDTGFGIRVIETKIWRTRLPDGTARDEVLLSEQKITEAMLRLDEAGLDAALVLLPDEEDIVVDTYVEVPKASLQKFVDHAKHLELLLEYVKIEVPFPSMEGFGEDLYFRIVPIKDDGSKRAILQRAGKEGAIAGDGGYEFRILGRPMRIETNMQSRPVKITLPLYDALPDDEAARKEMLDNLVIYIEHSDGTKEVIRGTITGYKTGGDLGIEFVIDKFSTFTMIYRTGANDDVAGGGDGRLPFELDAGTDGYLAGYPDGLFRPDRTITRAEMAVILAKNLRVTEPSGIRRAFPDVPDTYWAYESIKEVSEAGLMIGYPDGRFGPDNPISRAEMAMIMLRLSGLAEREGETFNDTKGHWASGAIESLASAGLVRGLPDGSFRPNRPLTRAEAVVMLNRVLGIAPLAGDLEPTWPDVPASHWAFRDIEAAAEREMRLDP